MHGLVIPLYGVLKKKCLLRLNHWVNSGFWVIVVNNNPPNSSLKGVVANALVHHNNRHGLAGGFNAGVKKAIEDGCESITLLDQDSEISVKSLNYLKEECKAKLLVGPCIIDKDRGCQHTYARNKIGILISSGTTFKASTSAQLDLFTNGWKSITSIMSGVIVLRNLILS